MPGIWQIASVVLAFVGAGTLIPFRRTLAGTLCRGPVGLWRAGLTYTVYLLMMMRVRETTESWGALAMASTVAAAVLLPASSYTGEQVFHRSGGRCCYFVLLAACWAGLLDLCPSAFQSTLLSWAAAAIATGLSAAAGWLAFGEALDVAGFTGSFYRDRRCARAGSTVLTMVTFVYIFGMTDQKLPTDPT